MCRKFTVAVVNLWLQFWIGLIILKIKNNVTRFREFQLELRLRVTFDVDIEVDIG